MNAFQRSAVFAAVFVLLALHAEATVSQPTTTFQTCSFYNSITSTTTAVTEQYNPWTQFCCTTGIRNLGTYSDPLGGCCSDISTHSCPTASNTTCCRPATPWTDNDPDVTVRATTRDCYNPAYQGCCQATFVKDYNNGTTRNIAAAAVFDSETQQCCSVAGSMPVSALVSGVTINQNNAATVSIAPKGTTSCIMHLRSVGVEFRCTQDIDCPGAAVQRGKCCRQQMAFGEDPTSYAYRNWGRCYDPKFEDCCNAWVGQVNASQTTQVNFTQIINLQFHQCCKLPVWSSNGDDKGNQVYAIPVSQKCPCLQNSDCGGTGTNANYTCCAPTQAQIQGGEFSTRRLVQCAVAGQATNVSGSGFADNTYTSRFPGCYGKCIPSGTNPAATTTSAPVCLNSLPSLASCSNLRVENRNAFDNANPNLLLNTVSQWVTPSIDDLIRTESTWHGADCCKGNPDGEFSVLYWQQRQLCCPVMGTAPQGNDPNSGVNFPRRLTPVVPRTALSDDAIANNNPTAWGGCLCSETSQCQTGYVCCQNGLSWVMSPYLNNDANPTSTNARKARQLIYSNNGTALTGICIDPKTTECCEHKKNDPDTFGKGSLATNWVQPYIASSAVCCAEGGVQNSLGSCDCHTDADCQNGGSAPWGACCAGNGKWGAESHATAGKCYDTRRQSCCRFHSATSDVPVQDGIVGLASVFDNTTQVCCLFGGPKAQLSDCKCRSDMESTDCGANAKCCAGVVSSQQTGTTYRNAFGFCYDTAKNQSCCQSRATAIPANTIAQVYDNNKQVCCMVNGVQRDHRMCSCSSDAHCPANGQCCTDGQSGLAGARVDCSDFPNINSNTPSSCPGKCIHKELETCCDNPWTSEWKAGSPVQTCVKDYQKCCDGTCCNKALETCKKTTRNWYSAGSSISKLSDNGKQAQSGAVFLGLNSAFPPGYHYGLDETAHVCTATEHSSPSIVFHTWVFPAFLSVASIIVVVLGSRAGLTADLDSSLQRLVLVGLQVFVAIMSILLLWSPLWKYGFGIIFANSFILHAFVVGGQWTRRFACILMVVTFLWVYEPFGTNSILNFGTVTFAGKGSAGQKNGYEIHGLNFAARMLQRNRDNSGFPEQDACVQFYQYWKTDTNLHDARTWNPEGKTRGICRRSWMHTISVLAGIIMPFEAVWLFLAAIAFAKASQHTKDVKVQPIQA